MRWRSALARLLTVLLAFSVASGPLASAIHAESHLVHAAPIRYEPHDAAAHRLHHPLGDNAECPLCTLHKTFRALVVAGPDAPTRSIPEPALLARVVSHPTAAVGRLPASRAPPSTSL